MKLISFMAIVSMFLMSKVQAQNSQSFKWETEPIRGERFKMTGDYDGEPFFTREWCNGHLQLNCGETVDSLRLRYNAFLDQLVYYNETAGAQIIINKNSIRSFSFTDTKRGQFNFRKQTSPNYAGGDWFFEVLYEGNTDLICYRKVELRDCSSYYDEDGKLKSEKYVSCPRFFFYSEKNGYMEVKAVKKPLSRFFVKEDKKKINKLLGEKGIKITGEQSFVNAWKIIDKHGFTPSERTRK